MSSAAVVIGALRVKMLSAEIFTHMLSIRKAIIPYHIYHMYPDREA